jgi:hypothetical protein
MLQTTELFFFLQFMHSEEALLSARYVVLEVRCDL